MSMQTIEDQNWPKLKNFPMPAKALVSAVILTMALGLTGALGQIVVHDIIPTFFSESNSKYKTEKSMPGMEQIAVAEEGDNISRGDLLSGGAMEMDEAKPSFFESEQFVWTLKWTHIHLFGMNTIFIIMGAISIFLDLSIRIRTWLVILPFVGVFVDIAAMWLKAFVSPAFFWLHIPGGGVFGAIFVFVLVRGLYEMWFATPSSLSKAR